MQHKGEESNEISFSNVQENMLHSDAVPSLPGEQSKLIALFPTVHAHTHLRWFPAYVEEVQSGFTGGRIEAWRPSKIKREHTQKETI